MKVRIFAGFGSLLTFECEVSRVGALWKVRWVKQGEMFKTIILLWGTSNLPEHLLTQHPINYKSKASSKKQATLDLLSKPWHCSEARAKDRIRGMLVLVSCALCTQINHEGVNKGRMAKKILLSSQLCYVQHQQDIPLQKELLAAWSSLPLNRANHIHTYTWKG